MQCRVHRAPSMQGMQEGVCRYWAVKYVLKSNRAAANVAPEKNKDEMGSCEVRYRYHEMESCEVRYRYHDDMMTCT